MKPNDEQSRQVEQGVEVVGKKIEFFGFKIEEMIGRVVFWGAVRCLAVQCSTDQCDQVQGVRGNKKVSSRDCSVPSRATRSMYALLGAGTMAQRHPRLVIYFLV